MKVVLANVKYSPNLGDGVIAECFEKRLRERLPDAEIISCDLAGRTSFGVDGGRVRSIALFLLKYAPDALKDAAYRPLLATMVRMRLAPHYRNVMTGASAVIFGGGQLFADADLNFPFKIHAAATAAKSEGALIAVHGAGVGADWSPRGRKLFDAAMQRGEVFRVGLRDEASIERWRRSFVSPPAIPPRLTPDPGLLAGETFGRRGDAFNDRTPLEDRRPTVGVCVTHPTTLSAHKDRDASRTPDASFFAELCRKLIAAGLRVRVFSNGAPDDEAFLRGVFTGDAQEELQNGALSIAPHSRTPADLAAVIQACDAVVAHRLHALIVAYAYRIPHIGLSTNAKLDQFFDMTLRRRYCLSTDEASPDVIAQRVDDALREPIDSATHEALLARARGEIDSLADAIRARASKLKGSPASAPSPAR